MKTIFFNIPAQGHINPMLSVVAELVKRGEEVLCVNTEAYRAVHERLGARFHAYQEMPELEALMLPTQNANLQDNALALVRIAEYLLPPLLELVERERPDYIIHDSLAGWGRQAAWRYNIPHAAVISTFALTPKAMPNLPPSMIAKALWGAAVRLPAYFEVAKRMRQQYGVRGVGLMGALMNTGMLNVVFTSRQFQPAGHTFGPEFAFVGPAIGERPHDAEFPFDQIRRPALYIAFGTILNNRPDFYRKCFAAFADHPGTVVLSAGKNTDLSALGTPPPNFLIRPFVPQLEVLQHSDVFITHGGMNSVQEGLTYGVPLVVMPQHMEQALVAGQVVASGAGLLLEDASATAESLRAAVARVLGDSSFKVNAARLGESLRAAGGAAKAAEVLVEFGRKAR
ncbi:MAG: macrolide family glycosyltransferase [Anaerolineae bacterium]